MADGGTDEPAIEALRLTREESRVVLDHRIAMLNDLDDKAMRTVRTDLVVLGVLASAAGIAGPDRLARLALPVKAISVIAGGCLFFSALVGIGVYVASDITVGIGSDYRTELRMQGYTEREWLEVLLDDYDEWTRSLRRIHENNALYLTVSQILLGVGLVLLVAATSLLVVPIQL